MFEDLNDAISYVWSYRWPSVEGEISALDIECMEHHRRPDTWRLAVAYKFSIGDDGPYSGESFWEPLFFSRSRVKAARHKFHIGKPVLVRYRSDDPSVNRLDSNVWKQ